MRRMTTEWFSGKCGGPRVRGLDDGSYEIEGFGRPVDAINDKVKEYQPLISQWAVVYGVPQAVIAGVMMRESMGNRAIVSADGGIGLMQLTSAVARGGHSKDELINDVSLNIEMGTKLLSTLWQQYQCNIIHVLTSYNAGSPRCAPGKNPWNLVNTNNYVGGVIALINGAVDTGLFAEDIYPINAGFFPSNGPGALHLLTFASSVAAGLWLFKWAKRR